MNKSLIIILMFFIPLFVSGALENSEQFHAAINDARDIHYSGRASEAAVSRLDRLMNSLNDSSEGSSVTEYYRKYSEIYLLKGLFLIDMGEKSLASDVLAEGIDFCETRYLEGGEQFFLVQTALLKSHWMLLQKTSVLIRTGGEIQEMTDLALELDPDDFTARLLSAQGLINAPPLFGGNPVEAARILISSESLIRNEYDRFDLYLTLADARRKKKAWDDAGGWCTKALSLFPENADALKMQDLITARKK
ncbi:MULTISPECIES: M48 family metallopeptidase [unclassified Oceanispirochaeta]|uniref:tetratricopeptide repeat protein n=1 Tax=unclassified Oceanispirochaeta TaxID=2635722 RepID=UPI000E08EE53|nr:MULTISPECIES: hypothetical protein [unclassified Oceanispirochaeta]MBF9017028.1 hypothetical protein [Oceanispirochaeta sp. M2]NPD73477.1 hypothetical protein [Oceanispirochaeta sp. M1]RDG30769.1 hypothetical protein DV872_15380 [Oceanispirochaeta sp. M1]